MVMPATKPAHVHKFEINKQGIGNCKCGEVRAYLSASNLRESSFKVLTAGDPNYKDPPGGASPFRFPEKDTLQKPAEKVESLTGNTPQPQPAQVINPEEKLTGLLTTRPKNPHLRANWYDQHRAEIEADIKAIGEAKTRDKWDISYNGWTKILKRWNRPAKEKKVKSRKPAPSPVNTEAQRLFEVNRQAIINDYNEFGEERAKKNWAIADEAWKVLKTSWGLGDSKPAKDVNKQADSVTDQPKIETKPPENINNSPVGEIYLEPGFKDRQISRLIDYWRLKESETVGTDQKTLITMTIDALENIEKLLNISVPYIIGRIKESK